MQITRTIHPSLVDTAENRLRTMIREAKMQPGDAFPGEMELSQTLGVSRNVLREALSRLRMLGVLDSKKRRGMELAEPDVLCGLARVIDLPILGKRTQDELGELRLIVEMGMTDLVFLRKTTEAIEALDLVVQQEEKEPFSAGLARECDIAFHQQLYAMTGNHTLERFQLLLKTFFGQIKEDNFRPDRFEENAQVSHRDLLDALEGDYADAFNQAMRMHLSVYFVGK